MSKLVENVAHAEIIAYRENAKRVMLSCGHMAAPNYSLLPDMEAYASTPGEGVSGTPGSRIPANASATHAPIVTRVKTCA